MNKKEVIKDIIDYSRNRKEKICGYECPIAYITRKYFGKSFFDDDLDEYANFIQSEPEYESHSSNCVVKLACLLKNFGLKKFSDVEKFVVREGHKSSFCLCRSMDKEKLFEKEFSVGRNNVKI